jgi:hypothetical protein
MSATAVKQPKAGPLRWVTRAIGTLTALAGVGLLAAAPGLAVTGTGTITITSVYFDSTTTDHQEGVTYSSWSSGPIASFTDSTACPTPTTCQPGTDFTTRILWGDGTTTTICAAPFTADCSISAPTNTSGTIGSYDISASHAFVDEKNGGTTAGFTVRVLVKDVGDGEGPVTADNSANGGIAVSDQCLGFPDGTCSPLTQPAMSFTATSGTPFTSKKIGSFQDANQLSVSTDGTTTAPEYSLSIVWGDGSAADTTSGTFAIDTINCGATPGLAAGSGCPVNLYGSHMYTTSGTKTVTITVGDGLDKHALIVTSTANVGASGNACTAVGVGAVPSSPQQSGTIVTVTAVNQSACSNPEYLFYVQATGGSWILARGYGGPTYVWNTAGDGVTSYNFDVWIRQKGSGVAHQAFAVMPYTLTTPQACTGATLGASPSSPRPTGTQVTFTASASTCSQPQYEFWVQATGGSWILGRSYGTSPTYLWTTTGDGKTTYNVDVWARQNGSKVSEQTVKVIQYQLT